VDALAAFGIVLLLALWVAVVLWRSNHGPWRRR
jgi:hypothetical protein